MNYFPVAEGTTVKGAVLVCAGGAFQFRSDRMEGTPVAQWFARHGYQAFVVNYRVQPYRMEEGSLTWLVLSVLSVGTLPITG